MRRIVLPSAGRDHLLLPGMFVSGRRGLSHHTTDASGDRTEDEIEPTELTEIVKTPVGRPRRAQKRFEPAGPNRKTIRAGRPEPTNDSSRPAGAEKRFESSGPSIMSTRKGRMRPLGAELGTRPPDTISI